MATRQDIPLAPASKADEAQRLISQSISAAKVAVAGLERLQHCRNQAKLIKELALLRGIAIGMADAASCVGTTLEAVIRQR